MGGALKERVTVIGRQLLSSVVFKHGETVGNHLP